jgi:hypothetical protein
VTREILRQKLTTPHTAAGARHSGMFLAGIQGTWQFGPASLYAGLRKYDYGKNFLNY